MDEAAQFRPDLIPKFFELGLMGIEVPERVRRRRRRHLHVRARHRGAGPGRRVGGDLRGRAEHAGEQRASSAGAATSSSGATSRGSPPSCSARTRCPSRAAAATPSRSPPRAERTGDGWELTGRKIWITNGAEAGVFVVFANADSVQGLQGHHGVHRRAGLPRVRASARRRTSSASARPAPPS